MASVLLLVVLLTAGTLIVSYIASKWPKQTAAVLGVSGVILGIILFWILIITSLIVLL